MGRGGKANKIYFKKMVAREVGGKLGGCGIGEAKRGKCIQKDRQNSLGQLSERRAQKKPLNLGLWI